jgi:protein ImuA
MFQHTPSAVARLPLAVRAEALPGLGGGQLHEIHAAADDWAAALAFAFAAIDAAGRRPVMLVHAARQAVLNMQPYGEGLIGLGLDPARLVLVEARDGTGMLRAGLEGARCPGLAAVVLASWRRFPEYALTASRRLVLAAERSRVPVIMLRGDAEPRPSAAHQRWLVRSARANPREANAPGLPALDVELQRRRGGASGGRWRLEWNDQDGCYREARNTTATQNAGIHDTPLSGAVVCLSAVRTGLAGDVAASRAA